MVWNSQNEMMSWPCGRRSKGYSSGWSIANASSSASQSQPALISGVSEEVAHVSNTSSSASNSSWPHSGQASTGGSSASGSTGRSSFSAITGSSQDSQYHTGNGMPESRWREISQSHSRPSIQCSYRENIFSGYQSISRPASRYSSLWSRISTYHCLETRYSTGVSQRSWTCTAWEISQRSRRYPSSSRSSTMASRASSVD